MVGLRNVVGTALSRIAAINKGKGLIKRNKAATQVVPMSNYGRGIRLWTGSPVSCNTSRMER
jgi:hypothetical protein